jgi:hypothetical protein
MARFRRREARTVKRLAKVLAALDEHAASRRPQPARPLRASVGAQR